MLFLLFAKICLALTIQQSVTEFDQAAQSKNFVKFAIQAKKLGLFSSTVVGYAKAFTVTGKVKGDKIDLATIVVPVKQISTDLYARDDQMWNFCFAEKSHPEIRVEIKDLSLKAGEEKMVPGKMWIRGKEKEIQLKVKNTSTETSSTYEGSAELSFSQLEIPDPSIGVASVKDSISVSFSFQANQ
jgi:polyisoprenoid-binding protein YceI